MTDTPASLAAFLRDFAEEKRARADKIDADAERIRGGTTGMTSDAERLAAIADMPEMTPGAEDRARHIRLRRYMTESWLEGAHETIEAAFRDGVIAERTRLEKLLASRDAEIARLQAERDEVVRLRVRAKPCPGDGCPGCVKCWGFSWEQEATDKPETPKYVYTGKKPTLLELEEVLSTDNNGQLAIEPDGSITVIDPKPTTPQAERVPSGSAMEIGYKIAERFSDMEDSPQPGKDFTDLIAEAAAPFITSAEQAAHRKGRAEGLREASVYIERDGLGKTATRIAAELRALAEQEPQP